MKKGLFSKIIIALCLLFIIAYTIVIVYTFYKHGNEPTILTPLVYSFFGGELVMLFLKKRLDIVNNNHNIIEGEINNE